MLPVMDGDGVYVSMVWGFGVFELLFFLFMFDIGVGVGVVLGWVGVPCVDGWWEI